MQYKKYVNDFEWVFINSNILFAFFHKNFFKNFFKLKYIYIFKFYKNLYNSQIG